MAGDMDLFEAQQAGKEGLADTYARLVGRRWENAFPTNTVFEVRNLKAWLFGRPYLTARNNGVANWYRGGTSPFDQKGATGWLADLNGGVQSSWDDWARVNIPVNEMPIGALTSALWTYYMDTAQTMGVNMVVFVHDPTDNDKRAEITQQADIATLEKGTGWNAHELSLTVDQFYWYGENCTGAGLTEGTPNYYGMNDFQGDGLFSKWTIYRITFDNGWENSGTFGHAYVADIKLNGMVIPLQPEESWVNPPTVVRILHPFGKGVATAGGAQYGTLITGIATTYTALEAAATIYNPIGYTLVECEIGMMGATDGSGTTDSIIYEVQGSDAGTSWDTISSIITRTADASALADFANILAGRIDLASGTNFKGAGNSFQIRVVAKSGGTTDTAGGKMKNSSYVICIYRRTGG